MLKENFLADLIKRILEDAKEFDTRIWIAAVAIGKLKSNVTHYSTES